MSTARKARQALHDTADITLPANRMGSAQGWVWQGVLSLHHSRRRTCDAPPRAARRGACARAPLLSSPPRASWQPLQPPSQTQPPSSPCRGAPIKCRTLSGYGPAPHTTMRWEAITLPSAARGYGERSCDPESALRVGLGFCPVGEPAATAPRSGRLETDSAGRAAADEETTLLASFRGCTKQSGRLP